MTKNTNNKKRKHNDNNTANTNPLAQARRMNNISIPNNNKVNDGNNSATATANSKDSKNDKIDQIWFRKCHIGYQCFVEYYMNQSIGIIIPNTTMTVTAIDNSISSVSSSLVVPIIQQQKEVVVQQQSVIVGMSRASQKRRMKKKGKCNEQQQSQSQQQYQPQQSPQHQTTTTAASFSAAAAASTTNNNSKQQNNHNKHPLIVSFHSYCIKNEQKKNQYYDSYKVFFETMSKPLPLTFRIRQSSSLYNDNNDTNIQQFRQDLTSFLSSSSETISDNNNDQVTITPPIIRSMKIQLYHNNITNKIDDNDQIDDDDDIIYQSLTSKYNTSKECKDLLLQYQSNGIIARQELGSMIPVASLQQFIIKKCCIDNQIKRNTKTNKNIISCLDMCASPGSKTLQLYETLLTCTVHDNSSCILIANDISENRLNALKDSIQRSGVIIDDINNNNNQKISSPRLIYTCQDATKFELLNNNNKQEVLQYDIILCDVPCSGDGTYRKDNTILLSWKPNISNILYHTQIRILLRAIQLCNMNGYICYSTCSFNPIENEAVVSTLLQQYDNNNTNEFEIKVVDCPIIPGLILHPGITNWKVAQYNNKNDNIHSDDDDDRHHHLIWYDTYEDAIASSQTTSTVDETTKASPNNKRIKKHSNQSKASSTTIMSGGWVPTMWPMKSSSNTTIINEQLIKCRRLLPHDHDSGGFFIAILHKKMMEKKRYE